MTNHQNTLGQAVGWSVAGWQPPGRPPRETMTGRYCRLEPLAPERHAWALFEAYALDAEGRNWTYLPYGPFADPDSYRRWLDAHASGDDPLFFAIADRADSRPLGVASYLRIKPGAGSIEVGHLNFSPLLQGTRMATEAMYLMMRRAFQLGYRRYEWKCDALNAPSLAAARRLGFRFEGVFRQALVYKGRNRDTAWLSITDGEWPGIRAALETWLAPENFDGHGRQKRRLAAASLALREGGAAGVPAAGHSTLSR